MTTYEELLKTNRAPSLKELILSLTWSHDHLLTNPDDIRKFFYNKAYNTMHYADVEDFRDEENMSRVNTSTHAGEIFNALIDEKWMMFYDIYDRGQTGNTSCCTCEDHIYTRYEIDHENNKINIVSKYVPVNVCSDMGGGTHYKMPKPCVIEDLTFNKFLTLNPRCIEDLDLEKDLELILKEIGEMYP